MRIRRITWRTWGMSSEAEIRARYAFRRGLEDAGATVAAWMFVWEVRW
jgi:hypothetical protein